jgi:hypothetical protein
MYVKQIGFGRVNSLDCLVVLPQDGLVWGRCQKSQVLGTLPKNRIYLKVFNDLHNETGRAIAQAVSRRLPTAAAWVRAQFRSCGICGGQSGTGVGFSEYFGFLCQFSFHRLLHTHHLSSGAGIIDQLVADVPSGLNLTHPKELKKNYTVRLHGVR